MKSMLLLASTLLLTSAVAAASPPQFRFSGELRADQSPTEAYGLTVEAGHVRFLELEAGLKLEVSASQLDGQEAQTLTRLLQADGDQFRVLHEARTNGPADLDRSFSYLVCGSKATFMSPAPATMPTCGET